MKILHISHSDIVGGAARASYRLHKALLNSDIDSQMMVRVKKTDDWTILNPKSHLSKLAYTFSPTIGSYINKLQKSKNINLRSGNWLPSNWANKINSSDADLVNIHWIGNETLSIRDIGRIKKPIVWTMHDMWPFCGAEHYAEDSINARWRSGYTKGNRSNNDSKIDIDKLVWLRKTKAWKETNIYTVSPSQWLAECAKQSSLFQNRPITVIPNPLDTDIYKPLDKKICRDILKLPQGKNIILFGAIGGGNDPRKGYDLLINALGKLKSKIDVKSTICVVFGQSKPYKLPDLPFTTLWLGHLYDDTTLSLLYNSANVMIVPSRVDNLPQTATEAQSCGIPVIAFNTTGLQDIIAHLETGYLAKAFDTEDMANGIQLILNEQNNNDNFSIQARKRAVHLWSTQTVISQYHNLYKEILFLHRK